MLKARAHVHRRYEMGGAGRRLSGGLVEHQGRCVCTGVHEPGHPCAEDCERVRPEAMGEGLAAVSGALPMATQCPASFAPFRLSVACDGR